MTSAPDPSRRKFSGNKLHITCFFAARCSSAGVQGFGGGALSLNIPGWVAAVIKQAVLLLGCLALHFALCPGSARGHVPLAHSRIFGSGGLAALAHHPPFPLPRLPRTPPDACFGVQTSVVLGAAGLCCLPESPSPNKKNRCQPYWELPSEPQDLLMFVATQGLHRLSEGRRVEVCRLHLQKLCRKGRFCNHLHVVHPPSSANCTKVD